jgi:hypothetical protein
MKQQGFSVNFIILGGALAIADSRASFSEENENAFRYLEAVAGFLATPFWLVLIVAIQRFVAVLWYTVAVRRIREWIRSGCCHEMALDTLPLVGDDSGRGRYDCFASSVT